MTILLRADKHVVKSVLKHKTCATLFNYILQKECLPLRDEPSAQCDRCVLRCVGPTGPQTADKGAGEGEGLFRRLNPARHAAKSCGLLIGCVRCVSKSPPPEAASPLQRSKARRRERGRERSQSGGAHKRAKQRLGVGREVGVLWNSGAGQNGNNKKTSCLPGSSNSPSRAKKSVCVAKSRC